LGLGRLRYDLDRAKCVDHASFEDAFAVAPAESLLDDDSTDGPDTRGCERSLGE
jgi:hypothetical protein